MQISDDKSETWGLYNFREGCGNPVETYKKNLNQS